ncbi:cyanophycin synthetase [Sphingosinicella terrae]|uniref:cyanophycin synthetase n=1 Tax=Sphingosinicella terrae TaxID=2172047 RepID=UPI0025468474|nr:cyanophycin synthetase [Sphingosinicella terrae]
MSDQSVFFGASSDAVTRLLTQPVRVLETGVYRGPHYYSHTPMVRIQLDLGRMEDWPSDRIEGFADRLLAMLPGLDAHGCCFGRRGGFVRRLREGTWLGHIFEHVALELQTMAGDRLTRGKTRSVKGRPGVYNVMYAYRDEGVALAAGRCALELVDSLLPADLRGVEDLDRIHAAQAEFDLETRLADLRRMVRDSSFGPTTQSLIDAARRRGIPVIRLDERSLIQLGYGCRQQRIRASITGRTSLVAVEIAGNKDLTKKLLADSGLPVPRGTVVRTIEEALRQANRLGFPLVTKPLDGNHGRGVTTGIESEAQLRFGFDLARRHGRQIVLEQYFPGRDHRILVVNGQLVAVAERVPPQVKGDGTRTIAELIGMLNEDPRRGEGHEKVMTRIRVDEHLVDHIARAGLTVDSVPAAGEVVELRDTANLSSGGSAIDRTNDIHPENIEIARRAAAIIGIDVAGIDFIAPDISRSVRETGGGIIEVNAAPGFRMHLEPSQGAPRDVASPVIDMLFPRGCRGRIPIIAITGTNGKSTVGRMVNHILRYTGRTVGLTSTSGVYVNDLLVAEGDATGPRSASMVLRDPSVEVAVLETARGGILREGLAFAEADIACVLNVAADHLGLKGIETLEDLARLKSLITETVPRDGTTILNADDPLTVRMARRAGGSIIWFSLHGGDDMPECLRRHIDRGRTAVVREPGEDGGCLVLHSGGRREVIMPASDIPATIHGAATFNIANALAACAIAVAHDVPLLTIRSALSGFRSSFEQNPGRLNVHDAHGFRIIVDYAHNAAGLSAIGDLIDGLRHRYQRTIGVLSIPGDRRDEDILEMGRLAAGIFEELYFREDPGTRGRPRGQIMNLLKQGALECGADPDRIRLVTGEPEATEAALRAGRPGDLMVITPTDVSAAWKQVCDFAPAGATDSAARRPLYAAE